MKLTIVILKDKKNEKIFLLRFGCFSPFIFCFVLHGSLTKLLLFNPRFFFVLYSNVEYSMVEKHSIVEYSFSLIRRKGN